ncbi:MAG TPA: FAD:protein FMN transferase [Candidatus Polarisedimenticolia bacterium]
MSRARYLMGTVCEAVAYGDGAAGAIEAAFDEIARLEQVLSDYKADSDLSRLNRAAGRGAVPCPPDLYDFITAAVGFSRETRGAFDITVGPIIDAWDLRGRGRVPSQAELRGALRRVGWSRIGLDDAARSVRLPEGTVLDPGGLGKGFALDAAARVLRSRGVTAALLDFGGQILAIGAPPGEEAWEVSVAHPLRRDEIALALRLRDASISTSGNSEKGFEVAGRRLGHVVDPHSGLTVAADASATVIAPTGAEADACSTALLVMGPDAGLRWAEERTRIAALFLDVDRGGHLRAITTRSFDNFHPSLPGHGGAGADSMKGTR